MLESSIEDVTRKRRLLGIRFEKVAIIILGLLLILGWFHSGPRLAKLVGSPITLCIMAGRRRSHQSGFQQLRVVETKNQCFFCKQWSPRVDSVLQRLTNFPVQEQTGDHLR
jgi:hypothetical protein